MEQFQVCGNINGEKTGIMVLKMMNKQLKKKRKFVTTYWKDTMMRELINGAVTKVHSLSFMNMWRNKWYRGISHNIKKS